MKKVIRIILLFLLILTGCSDGSFKHGNGSENNPYLIYTVSDYLNFGGNHLHSKDNFEGKCFKLMNDLDFTGVIVQPIGLNYIASFNGHFDGNNHTMKNITITSSNENVGLFGVVGGKGIISNLNLENIDYKLTTYSKIDKYIGGIAGVLAPNATITNCSVTGKIYANYDEISENEFANTFGGGLVGNQIGFLNNCKTFVDVTANISGGLVGQSNGFKLNNCSVENSILYGRQACGGFIGSLYNNTIRNSEIYKLNGYNLTINSSYSAGGMVGRTYRYSTLSSCFINGTVNVLDSSKAKVGYIYGYGYFDGYLGSFYVHSCLVDLIINVTTKNKDCELYYGICGNNGKYSLSNSVIKGYMTYSDSIYRKTDFITYNSIVFTEAYHINSEFNYVDEIGDQQIFETLNIPNNWLYKDNNWYYLKSDEEILSELTGSGTKEDPYLLKSYEDLIYMHISNKEIHFKLENDIDCNNQINHSFNRLIYNYKINLDGNNKIIKNLNLRGYQLFATLIDSHIKDITFENLFYEFTDDFYYDSFSLFSSVYNSTFENVNISITAKYSFTEEKEIDFYLFDYAYNLNTINTNIFVNLYDSANINFYILNDVLKSNISTLNINMDVKELNNLNLRVATKIDEKSSFENNIVNIISNSNFRLIPALIKDIINQENQMKIIENETLIYPVSE